MGGHYSRRPVPSRGISDFCGIGPSCSTFAMTRPESAHSSTFCDENTACIVIKLCVHGILHARLLCRLTVPCESCRAALHPGVPQIPRILAGLLKNRDSLAGEAVICPLRNHIKGISPLPCSSKARSHQSSMCQQPCPKRPSCRDGKRSANPFLQIERDGSWPVALCRP